MAASAAVARRLLPDQAHELDDDSFDERTCGPVHCEDHTRNNACNVSDGQAPVTPPQQSAVTQTLREAAISNSPSLSALACEVWGSNPDV